MAILSCNNVLCSSTYILSNDVMGVNMTKRDAMVRGPKLDRDNEGLQTILFGFEEVEIWPKFCVRDGQCFQCHIEGKILCSPRFRL